MHNSISPHLVTCFVEALKVGWDPHPGIERPCLIPDFALVIWEPGWHIHFLSNDHLRLGPGLRDPVKGITLSSSGRGESIVAPVRTSFSFGRLRMALLEAVLTPFWGLCHCHCL